MTKYLPEMASSPILIVFCFVFLFYYLGLAFFSGIALFLIAFVLNYFLAIAYSAVEKEVLEAQDARQKVVSELVNNIKILRINSWA